MREFPKAQTPASLSEWLANRQNWENFVGSPAQSTTTPLFAWKAIALATLTVTLGVSAAVFYFTRASENNKKLSEQTPPDSSDNAVVGAPKGENLSSGLVYRCVFDRPEKAADFELTEGEWEWQAGDDKNPAAMLAKDVVSFRPPVKKIDVPAAVIVRFRAVSDSINIGAREDVIWYSIKKWKRTKVYIHPGQTYDYRAYYTDRYCFSELSGKASSFYIQEEPQAAIDRTFRIRGLAMESIEIRKLTESEFPEYVRNPEQFTSQKDVAQVERQWVFTRGIPSDWDIEGEFNLRPAASGRYPALEAPVEKTAAFAFNAPVARPFTVSMRVRPLNPDLPTSISGGWVGEKVHDLIEVYKLHPKSNADENVCRFFFFDRWVFMAVGQRVFLAGKYAPTAPMKKIGIHLQNVALGLVHVQAVKEKELQENIPNPEELLNDIKRQSEHFSRENH